jgi:succinate dehydrogenase / fumarate reductase cytochrome b subunit
VTAIQWAFVAGMTAVLIAVALFAAVVVRSALRTDGGAHPTPRLAARMLRAPDERAELNRWAFYVHRVTGVAIFAFLALHILDVSVYAWSRSRYDDLHEIYGSAPMRVFECALLLAILFHTFNGLRILAIDLADLGPLGARRLLAVAVLATVALGLAGSAVILAPLL